MSRSEIEELKRQLTPLAELLNNVKKKSPVESSSACPECGGSDRFFFKHGTNSGHCRQCEKSYDNLDIIMQQTGKTIPELLDEYGLKQEQPKRKNQLEYGNKQSKKKSKSIYAWNAASCDDERILKYFETRNVIFKEQSFPLPPALKFSEFQDKETKKPVLSIIAAVTNINRDTSVNALQRTFVDPDLKKINRIMKGEIANEGRGVWFYRKRAKLEDKLIIGEGLETVLSAMQATGINGVSGLDSGKMLHVELPDNITELFILVDEDIKNKGAKKGYAGQKTALKLAAQFEGKRDGNIAWIVSPSDSCFTDNPTKKDFNDLDTETILSRFENKKRLVDYVDYVPPDTIGQSDETVTSGKSEVEKAVDRYNKTFAAVNLAGKFAILVEEKSSCFDGTETSFWQKGTFIDYYCNDRIYVENANGKGSYVPVTQLWLQSPARRSYKGVCFDPTNKKYPDDRYNLFNGFNLTPSKSGSCSAILELMKNGACRGDEDLFEYMCAWFASIIKEPWKKTMVALIFSSGQGCGKGLIMEFFRRIFAGYYIQIINSNLIVGRFNDLLMGKILVYADEAVFAGNKETANKLKGLISEDSMVIEAKNIGAYPVDSFVNLVVSSNDDHVVNLEATDRRHAVFSFAEDHMNDWDYFGPIWDELRSGGPEALMQYLLDQDYSHVKLNEIPGTTAREEQKEQSLDSVQAFWADVLARGYIITPSNTNDETLAIATIKGDNNTNVLFDDNFEWYEGLVLRNNFVFDEYLEFCKRTGQRYPVTSITFSRRTLATTSKSVFMSSVHRVKVNSNTRGMRFGSIDAMRSEFCERVCDIDFGCQSISDDPPF